MGTSSPWRVGGSTTLLERTWPAEESERCGPAAGCVTRRLTAVTSRGSSPTTSTAGSGRPPWARWDQQTTSLAASSTPGPGQAPLAELSPTGSSNKTASGNACLAVLDNFFNDGLS